MKHFVLAYLLLTFACLNAAAQRICATHDYLQQQLQADPMLAQRIAAFKEKKEATVTVFGETTPPPQPVIIKIPVVVHVLYKDAAQNISDAQVHSQIEALNKDFRKLNEDTTFIPAVFKHLAADCQIEFELAKIDPDGRKTSGIRRRQTTILMYGMDDRIKHSSQGGDDAWDADSYLNIWVGNLTGGLLGYTSPMGCEKKLDGVAISPSAFGTTGIAAAPFNKGRTATHEIGHWLGLRHIWGDDYCGDDDIDDTPPQKTSTRNCPSGVVMGCNNAPAMYSNYMDFTDDACLNLFTKGQRAEMRRSFEKGGARYALLSSTALTGTPTREPAEPDEPGTVIPVLAKVYPNPANSFITVDAAGNQGLMGKTITLHNHLGQLSMRVLITKPVTQLNVQALQNGVYFVRVEGEEKVTKIVKTSN